MQLGVNFPLSRYANLHLMMLSTENLAEVVVQLLGRKLLGRIWDLSPPLLLSINEDYKCRPPHDVDRCLHGGTWFLVAIYFVKLCIRVLLRELFV